MTTLGELFDVAVGQLRAVAEIPPASIGPQERVALVDGIDQVLGQVKRGLGPRAYTPVPTTEERALTTGERNLEGGLDRASSWLDTAQEYLRAPAAGNAGPADERIATAVRALGAVRDTIGSHLGPDREPLTPYAYLLRHQAAFDYLTHRYSEVAWAGGQVLHRLAQGAEHPGAAEAFEAARTSLNQASVHARASARDADHSLASFPLALAVEPVQAAATDPTSAVTARLEQDSERLSRAAYGALHDRAEQRLGGSDLKQLSHWMAMARILSGQVLRHVAADTPDGPLRAGLNEAASALRTSSRAWAAAAQEWLQVVDIGDPRERPKLPPPGYELVRKGQVTQFPSTDPHPAVVISRTACVRVGQLMFGPRWTPEQAPGTPRPAGDILADAGGAGPLTASLYRLPAAGWQMAVAAPWTVRRAGAGLVTNTAKHRPAQLDPGRRFYPVHLRQVEALTTAYTAVMSAEQSSAGKLLEAALHAGTPVARAVLDASAHQAIAREQKWVTTKPVQAPPRDLPRAHVPTELLTGRRPGMRR
ncbi:hypothetical protein [Streptomyces sp. ISL-94]|uniref:hypothetical protein n=1 Tax=Streptomyces sp. ISL-94 TaxID=2819190 RepID=UPI001BE83232|nr:hypothetical protein [Streptomyces sp. ISL-94]MBT2478137.1 hypothetical protein [Streptomyces sp. ISL-94]